ncbi:MAG: hypothetical protein NVS9B1_23990 [Candidatus Dormibacteraceae bacterium]
MSDGTFRPFFAAALLSAGIAAAGCGGGQAATPSPGSASTPGASATATSTATTAPAPAAGQGSTLHLVLTGGPMPGTFDLKSAKGCQVLSTSVAGVAKKLWSAGNEDLKSPNIAGINFIIDMAKTPPQFTFGALGPFPTDPTSTVQQASYDVSTVQAGYGSGTADVQDKGATAQMSMKGQTKQGWGVEATAQCYKVERV